MKKITVLALAVIILCSCSNNTPSEPLVNTDLIINASLSRQESETSFGQVVYGVMLFDAAYNPVLGAVVTVSGPGGVTTLADAYSTGSYMGQFIGDEGADWFQFGQSYTVSVSTGGGTYTAGMSAPGSVSVAGDGSTVSWQYEGNQDTVMVMHTVSSEQVTLMPDQNSPVNLNATGIYNNGAGDYNIQANIVKVGVSAFSGASAGSALTMTNQYIATRTK